MNLVFVNLPVPEEDKSDVNELYLQRLEAPLLAAIQPWGTLACSGANSYEDRGRIIYDKVFVCFETTEADRVIDQLAANLHSMRVPDETTVEVFSGEQEEPEQKWIWRRDRGLTAV